MTNALEDEVAVEYERYLSAQERVRQEVRALGATKRREATVPLAHLLHRAHATGVPKRTLMQLTRKGTNWAAFSELWDAYTPYAGEFDTVTPSKRSGGWFVVDGWTPAEDEFSFWTFEVGNDKGERHEIRAMKNDLYLRPVEKAALPDGVVSCAEAWLNERKKNDEEKE